MIGLNLESPCKRKQMIKLKARYRLSFANRKDSHSTTFSLATTTEERHKIRYSRNVQSRLNANGSCVKKYIYYDHSYSPVVSWISIRILLIMIAIHSQHTKKSDYIASFLQAPMERDLYTKRNKAVNLQGKLSCDYVFKLHRNNY